VAGAKKPKKFKRVLVVSAHPDDPEFGFGGTVARLARDGAEVAYVICTDGSQGGEDPHQPDEELVAIREREQRQAAKVLGVKEVTFLRHPDGHLAPSLDLRREIVREIRKHRPELVLTHMPVRWVGGPIGGSHPDHLAVGEATLAAVYPDSRNPRAFRDLLTEGYQPHRVKEVWLPGMGDPDYYVDTTDVMAQKIKAIKCHQSQFNKPGQSWNVAKVVRQRQAAIGKKAGFRYAEGFKRIEVG